MLGSEPAPTCSTSLSSSLAWDLGLSTRMLEQDKPQMELQQIPAACKGLEIPSEPH